MQELIIEFINRFGYIGVFLLITIENIFPPIPSEMILTFGGFMTTFSSMNLWGVILSATIGSVLGAIILYILGRALNPNRLERLFSSKLGKILRLKKDDIKKAEKWFSKHGKKTVLFCRFVPIVRSLISIPAGIAKMKLSVFIFLTTLGTFIWNMILVYLGRLAGSAWERAATYVDYYSTVIVVFALVIASLLGVIFLKKRLIENDNKE